MTLSAWNVSYPAPSAAEIEDVRKSILYWVRGCRYSEDMATHALPWFDTLAPQASFWQLAGSEITRSLRQRCAGIVSLSRAIRAETTSRATAVDGWLNWTEGLVANWPLSGSEPWTALATKELARQNPLWRAMVAQSLQLGIEKSRLPKSLSGPLLPLLRVEQDAAQEWPVAPARNFPLDSNDYYVAGSNIALWREFGELLGLALDALAPLRAAIVAQNATTESRSNLRLIFPDELVRKSTTELASDARRGEEGWPVPIVAFSTKCEVWEASLRSLALHPAALIMRAAEDWLAPVRRLNSLRASLHVQEDLADAPTSPDARELSSSAVNLAAASRMHHPPVTPAAQLRELASQLEIGVTQGDLRAQFATRLRDLAAAWQGGEEFSRDASRRPPAAARNLLACLTTVDDLLGGPTEARENWTAIQSGLRGLLEELPSYRILDQGLLGQPLGGLAGLVEVVGVVPGSRVPPGHVEQVVQPGYVYQPRGESSNVLRRAKVKIADH